MKRLRLNVIFVPYNICPMGYVSRLKKHQGYDNIDMFLHM